MKFEKSLDMQFSSLYFYFHSYVILSLLNAFFSDNSFSYEIYQNGYPQQVYLSIPAKDTINYCHPTEDEPSGARTMTAKCARRTIYCAQNQHTILNLICIAYRVTNHISYFCIYSMIVLTECAFMQNFELQFKLI